MLGSCIEYGSIDETALIDNLHLIRSLRNLALTFLDYLILQTARQNLDTWLLGIGSQIFLASTSQGFLLELASLVLGKDSGIIGKSCHETTAEQFGIDRILGALQLLAGSWQDALIYHLGNLHTYDISCTLRSICLLDSLLVTTDEVCHISSIYLITLLDEWNQTTGGIDTSRITQGITLAGKNHWSYLLNILLLACSTSCKQRSTRHEDECCH